MPAPAQAVADAKAYLRIDGGDEDALLATLAGAATPRPMPRPSLR